jgi:murein DD-endopeptidase MepM/ murein hydrolase activator NlpD
MAKKEQKKSTWHDKYRVTVSNDTTFEEVWRVRITRYNGFLLVTGIILFLVISTYCLIAFTNVREFIPGYPDVSMRRNILMSAIRLDSLEKELNIRDNYFENLNAIISGKAPLSQVTPADTSKHPGQVTFTQSPEVQALRNQVETEERFTLSVGSRTSETTSLASLHFFPPVKGIVSGKYDILKKHFGTDIVTRPKSPVFAALDGTVIFTGWTMETGFVIQVQHHNNLVTVYKHNAALLKEAGDLVKAGEAISIVGDSGEMYTSGPHLHFEIWYRGTSLDPEKHVFF